MTRPTFDNHIEDDIKRIVAAEVEALNSPRGQKIMQELLDEAIKQNPEMTPDEWSAIKKSFVALVYDRMAGEE